MKFLSFFLIFLSVNLAYANNPNVGIIVKKQGKVELFTNPSTIVTGAGPHVLFEGTYYTVKKVRPGLRIKNGNILRTGKDSKTRIVFKNGDQFNIGEATAYKIDWEKKAAKSEKKKTVIKMFYGSIRGIVSKKGPRSGMKVKSRSAVMGVRGTDFYFGQRGTSGETSISVIRGNVEVAAAKAPTQKVKVKQGFSAELKTSTVKPNKTAKTKTQKAPEINRSLQLVKTTKTDLLKIQKDSKIEKEKEEIVKNTAVKKELEELEKKAVKATLNDIKIYQPKVYEELKDKKIKEVDTVNTVVVSKAFEKAPAKKIKPGFDDLNLNLDENSYDKYFKIDEEI